MGNGTLPKGLARSGTSTKVERRKSPEKTLNRSPKLLALAYFLRFIRTLNGL
jgi:hypothetical protein